MIYLLHFAQPFGKARHYLGTCADDRLFDRLREHALGKGSALTRAVVKRRTDIYLARIFPAMSYDMERRMKRRSHFKNYCPLCCPLLEKLASPPFKINIDNPDQQPVRAIWDNRPPLDIR